MHSFVISSKNLEKGIEEAKKISVKEKVDPFDLDILELESLGIEEVRQIQKKIYLKPFKGEKKSLILVLIGAVSDEAQNSMLKMLEEPPQSSLIFIIAQTHLVFLPTILSRVKIIELHEEKELKNENLEEILKIHTSGDALVLAQQLSKDKNTAISWLEDLILSARNKMLDAIAVTNKNEALKLRKIIHKVELAHYDLKNTNTNARLVLENLFLNLNEL